MTCFILVYASQDFFISRTKGYCSTLPFAFRNGSGIPFIMRENMETDTTYLNEVVQLNFLIPNKCRVSNELLYNHLNRDDSIYQLQQAATLARYEIAT